jgi:metal-responsive CopG/Arc/MetJ family transcriptional regulator
MHVHACMIEDMRTTIELDDDVRLELLRIAAQRGERGYSAVINDVLRKALREEDEAEQREKRKRIAERILSLAGTISDEEADAWKESVRESRRNWRER